VTVVVDHPPVGRLAAGRYRISGPRSAAPKAHLRLERDTVDDHGVETVHLMLAVPVPHGSERTNVRAVV